MDGLIIILFIIGIISRMGKKKKQREETLKKYRRDNAFAEAFPEPAKPAQKPAPKAKKAAAVKKAAEAIPETVKAAAEKIPSPVINALKQELPFTKEEWEQFIGGKEKAETPVEVHGIKQSLAEGVSPALKSTQGESEAEHKRHLDRIAAEEKLQTEKIQARQASLKLNRQKLRQAMVMSEVLGKPVALRGRRI